MMLSMFWSTWHRWVENRYTHKLALSLPTPEEGEDISVLLEIMRRGPKSTPPGVLMKLERLLALPAREVHPFTSADLEVLTWFIRRCATKGFNPEGVKTPILLLAISIVEENLYLPALPQIKLLVQKTENQNVKEAATDCFELLQAYSLNTENNRLLRPSSQPVDADKLLRPAGEGESTDNALLLRPIDKLKEHT